MAREHFERILPQQLSELADLVLDLRWTGSQFAGQFWGRLDPEAWETTKNPYIILHNCPQERIDEAAKDQRFLAELRGWLDRRRLYFEDPGWYSCTHSTSALKGVAYFSMEFGLSEALPIYSGGLGILAGDHLKSASDLGVPIVGIGLLYQQGYFRQVLADDGSQLEAFPFSDPSSLPIAPAVGSDGRWLRIRLSLPGRTLLLRVWTARVGKVTLYLLDSNDPMNNPWDRGITAQLYAARKENRFLQEICLGIGGWRLLEELGIEVNVCHLNEGHAAFAVFARALSFARKHVVSFPVAMIATRPGNIFTTHTPIEAAFDRFEPSLLARYAGPFIEATGLTPEQLLAYGRKNPDDPSEPFNMAYLAVRGCGTLNGVSQLHGKVSQKLFSPLFPGFPLEEIPIGSVTNGVHVPTWDSAEANELWTKAYKDRRWLQNLEAAAKDVEKISACELWDFRAQARWSLIQYVRRRMGRQQRELGVGLNEIDRARLLFDPNALIIGFARRFATYKRPTMLFRDLDRLHRILTNPNRPVQLIMAGKSHPSDDDGKEMVRTIVQISRQPRFRDHVVFIEDYDMVAAQYLAGGVDVWLNTPVRPAEACGTSGMKFLCNGGLNLSVLDGWWAEAYSPDIGWQVGDGIEDPSPERSAAEANQLYDLLEHQVVPEFYDRDAEGIPQRWIERVRASMTRLTPRFGATRMVREYVDRAYVPAAARYEERIADDARRARDLEEWSRGILGNCHGVRFTDVSAHPDGDGQVVQVGVYLGEVAPDHARVELYRIPDPGESPEPILMEMKSHIPGSVNGFTYSTRTPLDRLLDAYTARLIPCHPDAIFPLECQLMLWQR